MEWSKLTAPALLRACEDTGGVCILPLGSLEKHGPHLPTGTDTICVHARAVRAAEQEAAVVLPPLPYTQVVQASNAIGALSVRRDLLLPFVENICDEAARNGFRKIILLNGHGGNSSWLNYFAESLAERDRDYAVYAAEFHMDPELCKQVCDSDSFGHACEYETSVMLDIAPALVKPDAVPAAPGTPEHTAVGDGLWGSVRTSVFWYELYPGQYAGDARAATAAKGERLNASAVRAIIELIRRVKNDEQTPRLLAEFRRERRTPRA